MGIEVCFGILVAQESINAFVHTEYDYRIISMKDVISYYFVFLCGKIMIENGNGIIKVPDNKLEEFNTLLSEFYTSNDKVKIKQFIFDNCIDGITFKE